MGGLAHNTKARITYNGKAVIAYKVDIGSAMIADIDLHYGLCKALGIKNPGNFKEYVQVDFIWFVNPLLKPLHINTKSSKTSIGNKWPI